MLLCAKRDIPVTVALCQLILAGSFVKRGTGRRTALELYVGTGLWAAAMRRHNFDAVAHDIMLGPEFDVTKPATRARYMNEAQDVDVTHHGLECRTWSVAANGKYRSRQFLKGYPRNHPRFTKKRSAIARNANVMVDFTLDDFEARARAGRVCTIENPASSLFWKLRRTRKLLQLPNVQCVSICYCAYGTKYRKSTLLAVANWDGAAALASTCSCGANHVEVLMGSRTSKAAAYPERLTSKWTSLLSSHFR